MVETPAQDFLKPRLIALVAQAKRAGIETDVAVAVLVDLLDTIDFPGLLPEEMADAE